MKKFDYLFIVLIALAFISCNDNGSKDSTGSADDIYFGGDIITMEGDSETYAEAVAVKDGKIVFVGSKADAEKLKSDSTVMNDLQGKTLVPGFFDGHAHFMGFGAQAVGANLLPPPDGGINTIDDIIKELKDWYSKNGTGKTKGWIFGMGYDESVLKEGRHPTKAELDKVSKDIPIVIVHISGHFVSMNTKALKMSKITAATKNPPGGVIRRMPGSKEPSGVLDEMAAIPVWIPILSPTTPDAIDYFLNKGQEMAAQFGYTTVQEGRALENHEQMANFAKEGKLKVDVVSYVDFSVARYMRTEWYSRDYNNHYRIGGLKLTLDGSAPGRTAWRTMPYLHRPDGEAKDYKGYPAIADDNKVKAIIDTAFANNWQLLTHTNGDAAVDQLIRCMRPAIKKYGNDDRRNVMIHGVYIRIDQLDSLKEMKVIPSLFPLHTFYWGDWHKKIIGDSLGNLIAPINTAVKLGMMPTSHTDAPVALPNLIFLMWSTVNRVSRRGVVIGESERLTPYDALRSFTIWGARQHFEENRKGSMKVGKLADMVILDKNPLKVEPMSIKDINVIETIKEGITIYKQ